MKSEKKISPPKELTDHYHCGLKPKRVGHDLWMLTCKRCGSAWMLPVAENPNIDELLKHARSHD